MGTSGVDAELREAGIRVQKDPHVAVPEFLQPCHAGHAKQKFGIAADATQFIARQSVIVPVVVHVTPAGQSDLLQRRTDGRRAGAGIIRVRVGARIVTRVWPAELLDEDDFVARSFQAD